MNPEKPKSDARQPASILVVDDTPANLHMLAGMLKDRGYKVRPVPSGKLALLAARRDPPDLILLDINMPEMNGYEVCEHLKADDNLKGIPVIFISALTEPLDKVKAFAIGGVDYITKPFQIEELHARVETHLKLRRQQVELVEMGQALREADRHKDEFLAMLAHELRNPLTPICSAVQILKALGSSDPRLEWVTGVIDRQAQQLTLLVEDLLDVSRIIHGKFILHKESVELGRVVAQAVETSRPNIDARRHELTVSLPPQSVRLDADPARLVQVLANLLNNAAKYTKEGGRIWLAAEVLDGQVVVRVRDTGIGISREMLPHVFDLFTQVEDAKERSQGGLGIGLAMVGRLVQMHGGTVHALSEGQGRGSEFVTRLPILPEAPPHTGAGLEATSLDKSVSRRILLVDDNVDLTEILTMLLTERHGHKVQTAHDGPTAIETAKKFQPEVVFMDIGLPGMSGYDVARQLRTQPGSEKLLLIAVSGYGEEKDRRLAHEAGFDEHLLKPVSSCVLQRLVAQGKVGGYRVS